MAIERIDSIIDTTAVMAELTAVQTGLTKLQESLVTMYGVIKQNKGGDLSGLTKASEDLNGAIKNSTTAQDNLLKKNTELSLAVKAHENNLKSLATAQAKGNALTSDTALEIAKVNVQNAQQAKANKEVAASVLDLVDEYGKLKKEYNDTANAAKNYAAIALKTGNAGDIANATATTAKAKALHDSLLSIEQGVGQSQRNVGNYTGALKVLETALTGAKQKLDSMSQSEQQNTVAGQSLQKEVSLLGTLVGQQDKGFISLRREVMNSTQALATMQEQGLAHTAAFSQLQTEVSNA